MDEYINRKKTKRELSEWCISLHNPHLLSRDDTMFLLDNIPAADVAPVVHGHWVVRFDGPYKRRRCYCSHCGKHNGVGGIAQNQEKPYCPNCGARMDGGSNG